MPRHRGEAAAESRHCLRRCCCARAREAAIVRAASAWPRNCGRPSEAQPAIVLAPTVLVRVRVRVRDDRPTPALPLAVTLALARALALILTLTKCWRRLGRRSAAIS